MANLRLMTFNVENMLARFNFRKWEKERLATLLDIDSEIDRANLIRTHWNVLNEENRVCTALNIKKASPDVVCLQEVENMGALKAFHDRYVRRMTRPFKYKVLIDANDPRGIDVAVMSRFKIVSIVTHQDRVGTIHYPDGAAEEEIFRRDCLEVHVKAHGRILPIFVCHFKSMCGEEGYTKAIRTAEAREVRKIIEECFDNPAEADWVVVGDLNDYTETDGKSNPNHALGALVGGGFSEDLVKRITKPKERWTHYYKTDDEYHQLDYILVSPSLAEKSPDVKPTIIRDGQPFRAERYASTKPRWPRIGYDRPKASDHCPVVVDLEF